MFKPEAKPDHAVPSHVAMLVAETPPAALALRRGYDHVLAEKVLKMEKTGKANREFLTRAALQS